MTNVQFNGNTASSFGGAIYVGPQSVGALVTELILSGATFGNVNANTAGTGDAIFDLSDNVVVSDHDAPADVTFPSDGH